jgi:23S rRNA pseudouridine2605 synthase
MRLNQYIAKNTGISRRKADEVISKGWVKIGGELAGLGVQVDDKMTISIFNGWSWSDVSPKGESSTVLLMYKPPEVMTTRDDPEGRKIIYDLLPEKYKNYKTAGRLDFMSEGLLVLSENGHLILSMTHPKFKTHKTYLVGLQRELSQQQIDLASSGEMEIEGYKLNPVKIDKVSIDKYLYLNPDRRVYWYEFTLSEGRNRQIRKMATQFGSGVHRLIRIRHGLFELTPEIKKKGFVESRMVETKGS